MSISLDISLRGRHHAFGGISIDDFLAAMGLTGSNAGADFNAGRYWLPSIYDTTKPVECSEADWFSQFQRASTGTGTDANGGVVDYAVNKPRFIYDGGKRYLSLNDASTNTIPNSNFVGNGGVSSGGGSVSGIIPNNIEVYVSSGISFNIIGTGTELGQRYIDVEISGTPAASPVVQIYLHTGGANASAAANQVWTSAISYKIIGGSLTNVSGVTLRNYAVNSSGAAVFTAIGALNPSSSYQRSTNTFTLPNDAAIVGLRTALAISSANLGTISLRLRLYSPQTEQSSFATPYIPTSGSAVTRAVDSCRLPTAMEGVLQGATASVVLSFKANNKTGQCRYLGGATNHGILTGNSTNLMATNGSIYPAVSANLNNAVKVGVSWISGSMSIAANGGIASNAAGGSLPNFLQSYLGRDGNNDPFGDGLYSRIVAFPSKLSDAKLQAITA